MTCMEIKSKTDTSPTCAKPTGGPERLAAERPDRSNAARRALTGRQEMKGWVRRRGKSWTLIIDLGRGPDGRRRLKWVGGFARKEDAEQELVKLLRDLDTGRFVEPAKISVAEYLQQWLDGYARLNVSGHTCERYERIATGHLIPALGHHPLAKLRPLHIQAYLSHALASGRRDGRGGLSPRTVLHHYRVLREALEQAVKWQILAVNPADAVQPPRPEPREMRALDEHETARLIKTSEGSRLHVAVVLAATTGMRRGEILALRWEDADLLQGKLSVRQALEKTKGGIRFKPPKTAKGRPSITLPPVAVEALKRWRAQQAREKLLLGPAYRDHGLVVCLSDGRPYDPQDLSQRFASIARKAGLPGVGFHALRHGHASQLLRAGVHPKVVSERLGHATVSITLDIYSHLLPGLQEEAAQRIDAMLRGARAAQWES